MSETGDNEIALSRQEQAIKRLLAALAKNDADAEKELDVTREQLQTTEQEQLLLDGGKRSRYKYTSQDAKDAGVDWGAVGAPSDKNIVPIMKKR